MPNRSTLTLLLATGDDALARGLREAGINVTDTPDGFDAIRLAMESKPDAVILDDTTSGLPIPTVAVWLKLNPLTQSMPVIGLGGGGLDWQESHLDAQLPRDEAIERLADVTRHLIETAPPAIEWGNPENAQRFDPLSITLDLIEIYRERLGLASAMIQLASLQHDLGDFSATIKSILETAGQALMSPLVGITLLRERTHYILVREPGLTKAHLHEFEQYARDQLSQYLDKSPEIDDQFIYGRRRLEPVGHEAPPPQEFFGHPVYSRGKVLGYLAGVRPKNDEDQVFYGGLLPDLAAQVALLIVNADLISVHDNYVNELASILRAAIETSSISPLSDTTSKSFLLQFLLIILDLCRTDRGSVVLTDEENDEISEIAVLGCEESDIVSAPLRKGRTIVQEIPHLSPGEVILDSVHLGNTKLSRIVTPLTAGDMVVGGLVVMGSSSTPSQRLIEALKTLCSLAGYFIHNRSLHKRSIKSSIIEDQLNIAREIQAEMLPDVHPQIPGYDIFGRSVPAKEVGGDFYDYIFRGDSLNVAIADVCGKSIPASLLMTMARALFVAASEHFENPDRVLKDVNSHMAQRIGKGQFVTASLLKIDNGDVIYASAGHQPLLIYRAATDDFEEVDADGIAMGIVDTIEFERVHLQLNTGDIALMFTDGLNEAMNPERIQFGYRNIRSVIRENASRTAMEIVFALFDAITDHAQGADQFDDTTTVIIKKIKEEDKENAGNKEDQLDKKDQ